MTTTPRSIAAEQAGGGAADDHSIDIDTSEFLEDSGEDEDGDMELDEAETEGEPVPMPSAWSYLKDSSPTLTCFAGESFMTVGVESVHAFSSTLRATKRR